MKISRKFVISIAPHTKIVALSEVGEMLKNPVLCLRIWSVRP